MCRCCQTCWEDLYWNCFEEKFCYDESIANYNPEDDDDYIASQKNGNALNHIQTSTNNNLTVPSPICAQPLRSINSSAKIHEEDYRRETQTNVPMLGPEILAVFANSQIFQDHQPTKLNRISTRTFLPGVHSPNRDFPTTPRMSDEDRLIKRLEENLSQDATDAITQPAASPEKRITFTLTTDSSPEGSQVLTPKKFDAIAEEETTDADDAKVSISTRSTNISASTSELDNDEVILRPRLIDRHPHLLPHGGGSVGGGGGSSLSGGVGTPKKLLRSAKSVPHFNVRSAASETDIFSITGSGAQMSMTPEVPSISYSNLPKNYEDTPTIEKYRVSQSLYALQTENARARASQDEYAMPRYFRRSAMMLSQSSDMLSSGAGSSGTSLTSPNSSREEVGGGTKQPRRTEKEKSKRLQMLRGTLPPLLIHSVSFRKNRDEAKQVD